MAGRRPVLGGGSPDKLPAHRGLQAVHDRFGDGVSDVLRSTGRTGGISVVELDRPDAGAVTNKLAVMPPGWTPDVTAG